MKTFLEINNGLFTQTSIIIDVDGTVVPDKNPDISSEIIDKIKNLSQDNEVYICSNGSQDSAKKIAVMAGAYCLPGNKPFLGKWRKISPKYPNLVVIGDKYITDGLFALSAGAKFFRVKRLTSLTDSVQTKIIYFVDDVVWKLKNLLTLMRPWQWVKNLLVIAPVFFAGTFLSGNLIKATEAALLFSIVSSTLYIWNDIADASEDAGHPVKSSRPLPSGNLTKKEAMVFSCVLLGISLLGLLYVPNATPLLIFYIILNVLYSQKLKRVAVLDIILVASFYVMRVLAGGVATSTYISPWIILCTFFGSLFVIVGKRKGEYNREVRRQVLETYSRETLDMLLAVSAALSVIAYGIYSVVGHNSPYLVYSTVFVAFAIFRLMNRIYISPYEAEAPEILVFKDRWILASFATWVLYVAWVFYV